MSSQASNSVIVSFEPTSGHVARVLVSITHDLVNTVYKQATEAKRQTVAAHGFDRGKVPIEYIFQNYKSQLFESVKGFLLNYFVTKDLYAHVMQQGIAMLGEPQLVSTTIHPEQGATFLFELATLPEIELQNWRNFYFKAPKRKNYKDIDRQVTSFIKEETTKQKQYTDATIDIGDWVNFDISLINKEQACPLLGSYHESLWLRIGEEEADAPMRNCFVGRRVGDTFCSQENYLQNYFHHSEDNCFAFCITITAVVPNAFVCFDNFKSQFYLQTKKELHQKLTEVFSFRNDLSQRRATAEEVFRLFLIKHPFDVPDDIVHHEQELLLRNIRATPDYQVYKNQPRFKEYMKRLAEKQLKEALIADLVAYQESISTKQSDVVAYLNLTKRPRTKEFIYFVPPQTKIQGQEIPISASIMDLACRREKTLNHIIHQLARR